MALFVLQIAENGPAALDGRLKVSELIRVVLILFFPPSFESVRVKFFKFYRIGKETNFVLALKCRSQNFPGAFEH